MTSLIWKFWFLDYFEKNKLHASSPASPPTILLFLSGANAFIKKLTLSEFDLILKVQAVEEVICNAQETFSLKANSNNSGNLVFLQGKKNSHFVRQPLA